MTASRASGSGYLAVARRYVLAKVVPVERFAVGVREHQGRGFWPRRGHEMLLQCARQSRVETFRTSSRDLGGVTSHSPAVAGTAARRSSSGRARSSFTCWYLGPGTPLRELLSISGTVVVARHGRPPAPPENGHEATFLQLPPASRGKLGITREASGRKALLACCRQLRLPVPFIAVGHRPLSCA